MIDVLREAQPEVKPEQVKQLEGQILILMEALAEMYETSLPGDPP